MLKKIVASALVAALPVIGAAGAASAEEAAPQERPAVVKVVKDLPRTGGGIAVPARLIDWH